MRHPLNDTQKLKAVSILNQRLPAVAVGKYEELYGRLALEVPEFGWWSGMMEHQATRASVQAFYGSLNDLEGRLSALPRGRAPDQRRADLARAYRARLKQPIIAEQEHSFGLVFPSLEAGYIDPDFRVRFEFSDHTLASESYWEDSDVRSDLGVFLAGELTSPACIEAPLVVLGQPGAGKSLLTRILASKLPMDAFLPVLVELREVAAEDDIQGQIEAAIRVATGDTISWPELARSAGDALPVVLLDGFDELLQATRVNQTNYLYQVARFQRREADQGRPVAVIVTSRTAVADRARIPVGTVLLRLEPFRRDQVAAWLERWNTSNKSHFERRNLRSLRAETVLQHPSLASQPLLLLMLAIYDADANALQRNSQIDETQLYDQLLMMFSEREVRKERANSPESEIAAAVETELLNLSLVAFAMFNRGQQWVATAELHKDFQALLGGDSPTGLKSPLSQSDRVLGRFFFIHQAQAMRDGAALISYEFLHATFGEYLVARLVHRLVGELAVQGMASISTTLRPGVSQDGLLYALLSFAPLTTRGPVLGFLRGLAERAAFAGMATVPEVPLELFRQLDRRSDSRYSDYLPIAHQSAIDRFARYSPQPDPVSGHI